MKKSEKDEIFAAQLPGILQYHQIMLADGVRNKLLYEAIKKSVSPETSFLDIGAGTGVWAIMAAKLGAKRVVAVEVEECLIPIIHKHAKENGVAGRVEIIHGKSDHVKIRGKFDVIVSELFGNNAFGVETINSFVDLRRRFLAPGGVLIPQKLSMFAVPVIIENPIENLPAGIEFSSSFFKQIKQNYAINLALADRGKVRFLAEPKCLVAIDFRTITEPPPLQNLTASWTMDDLKPANAILTFNDSTFADDIQMDSFGSQSWGVNVTEFEPFDISSGELKYTVSRDQNNSNWSVGVQSDLTVKPQTFSPVFAFTRLRMAQAMTPHRKYNSPKPEPKQKKIPKKM